ncbi:hypothetical protein Zmor_015371 [Zophobas morio]|uniref:RING-type domain-containing protein n=1 Tax=Zophobas morio TaxID=2755281 RepID=A0AA38IK47_9CUCU|nr:hypothetical protein Zmor_015371 [Zophobas morio]
MSSRRKSARSSKRGRRMWLPADDDLPLSLIAMLTNKPPVNKTKPTPRRKPARRTAAATAASRAATVSEVIPLDDTSESNEILNNVKAKVGTFMETGSFISSDEDEVEITKTKNNKVLASSFLISDDSDDDFKSKQSTSSGVIDISGPSTSSGLKTGTKKILDDDIMEIVDSVLDSNTESKENNLNDIKSLEDFRKETEEMLKNASALLNEIKAGDKTEPKPKVDDSPAKVTVGSCPICFETLANRPASVTVCGHIFCKPCIMQAAQISKKCPTCRKAINSKKIHPIYF